MTSKSFFYMPIVGLAICGCLAQVGAAAESSPYIIKELSDTPAADANAAQASQPNSQSKDAVIVNQKGRAFVPSVVTLRVHRSIVIVNDDDTPHHAFCTSENLKYNSGPQSIGSSHPLKFDKVGTYEIRCAIHPTMKLVVTVTQ